MCLAESAWGLAGGFSEGVGEVREVVVSAGGGDVGEGEVGFSEESGGVGESDAGDFVGAGASEGGFHASVEGGA